MTETQVHLVGASYIPAMVALEHTRVKSVDRNTLY